jgi:hypothetical protein
MLSTHTHIPMLTPLRNARVRWGFPRTFCFLFLSLKGLVGHPIAALPPPFVASIASNLGRLVTSTAVADGSPDASLLSSGFLCSIACSERIFGAAQNIVQRGWKLACSPSSRRPGPSKNKPPASWCATTAGRRSAISILRKNLVVARRPSCSPRIPSISPNCRNYCGGNSRTTAAAAS